jgi:hypothetical protein
VKQTPTTYLPQSSLVAIWAVVAFVSFLIGIPIANFCLKAVTPILNIPQPTQLYAGLAVWGAVLGFVLSFWQWYILRCLVPTTSLFNWLGLSILGFSLAAIVAVPSGGLFSGVFIVCSQILAIKRKPQTLVAWTTVYGITLTLVSVITFVLFTLSFGGGNGFIAGFRPAIIYSIGTTIALLQLKSKE